MRCSLSMRPTNPGPRRSRTDLADFNAAQRCESGWGAGCWGLGYSGRCCKAAGG